MKRIEARLRDARPIISGVASGMANKFAWSCFWTRLAWGVGTIMNPMLGIAAYIALAMFGPSWSRPRR